VTDLLAAAYPWLKALHIIAVIAWMAGLLYLPRLFVYHAEAPSGSDRAATFEIMERRLARGIMLPAAAMTYIFGIMLAAVPGMVDWQRGWIWTKLGLVLLLTLFHGLLERWRRDFAARRNTHPARFYRIVNELPTLAMIGIVVLVVVKPF
jgi:protoporphyrinogen IX oxidase